MIFSLARRLTASFIFIAIFTSAAAHAGGASLITEILSKPIARWISAELKSDEAIFYVRDTWKDSHELRARYAQKINEIEVEFATFRASLKNPGKDAVAAAEKEAVVTESELELLTEVEKNKLREIITRSLREDSEWTLLVERTRAAIERNVPRPHKDRIRLVDGNPEFEGGFPVLPNMTESLALDVSSLDRHNKRFYRVIWKWLKDRALFLNALVSREGEWRSLYLNAGRKFTTDDWVEIHRWNMIMGAIIPKKQLELRLLARNYVPREMEWRLNELTDEALQTLRGPVSDRKWLSIRHNIVSDKEIDLGLSAFDIATEKIILKILDRCRKLGGETAGSIKESERLINELRDKADGYRVAIRNIKAEIMKHEGKLRNNSAKEITPNLEPVLTAEEIKVNLSSAHHRLNTLNGLARVNEQELVLKVSNLKRDYADFYESYYQLSVFSNARKGNIAGYTLEPIPFPDRLIATQAELDAWAPISSRALQNSIPAFIKKELKLSATTHLTLGNKFINEIDEAFTEIHGIPFTKSPLGLEYQDRARKFYREIAWKFFKYIAPPTVAADMADRYADRAISKWAIDRAKDAKGYLDRKTGKPVPDAKPVAEPETETKPTDPKKPVPVKDNTHKTGSPTPIVVTPPVTKPIVVKPNHPNPRFGEIKD